MKRTISFILVLSLVITVFVTNGISIFANEDMTLITDMKGASSNMGHTPYKTSEGNLMINNADSLDGWNSKDMFGTVLESASQHKEGNGAVTIKSTVPTGQFASVGAMTLLDFPVIDLTSYKAFSIRYRLSENMPERQVLQFNFVTGDGQDGYNYDHEGISRQMAGWYTVIIDKSTINKAVPNVDWASINRMRITWFNLGQTSTKAAFTIDEIMALPEMPEIQEPESSVPVSSGAESLLAANPYKMEDGSLMINDADATKGWNAYANGMIFKHPSIHNQGSAAISLGSKQSTGNAGSIGSMAIIEFNDFDLSDYEHFTFQVYNMNALEGIQALQINFITWTVGDPQEGYKYEVDISNWEAKKWYTVKFSKSDFIKADATADWSKISRIRLAWLNYEQSETNNMFIFDDIRAYPADYEFPETEEYIYGDVNDDKNVDVMDALLVLQHTIGATTLSEKGMIVADVISPKGVNLYDALAILQYSVDAIENFEYGPSSSSSSSAPLESEYIYYPPEPVNIPKSQIDNGAYSTDSGGYDASFKLTTLGIKPRTIYIIRSTILDKSDQHARLIYSLQGLMNREFGMDAQHTSVMYVLRDASDPYWFEYISQKKEGTPFYRFNSVTINTWSSFLKTFTPQLEQCGYIAWDPNVPATANVAATICGLDGYLPVMSGSSLETELVQKGFTKKMDLVGKFTGSNTGSPKNDAYRWALDNYFNRCSYDYVAYIPDGAADVPGNTVATDGDGFADCIENHDYLIARRAFFFDLDPYAGEVAKDAGGGKVGLDTETMKMIFDRRYKRAGGKMGALMGFIPWWLKYASDCGNAYAGSQTSFYLEWLLSEMIACFNLSKEADAAHPVSMSNGSVFYKYTIINEIKNNKTAKVTNYNPNVHYWTIYVGDYDSSAWLKNYVAQFWMSDPNRGKVDLMWCINPNLSYRVPMCFEYMYNNLTNCDYMAAGEGGGYLIPSGLFTGKRPSYYGVSRTYEDGSQAYADYAKKFYDLLDIDYTGFIIMGANNIDGDIMNLYNKFNKGAFHNDFAYKFISRDGVPYIYLQNGIDSNTDVSTLYNHSFSTMSGYNFSAFRTVCQSPTQIKSIVDNYTTYCVSKGRTAQYVDPYSFFNLAKASGKLVAR